ncbi:hypothetical protein D3C87_189670 [compost metagenome]
MRFFLFVLTFCASTWALASEPIAGLLHKDSTGIYMQVSMQGPKFKIVTSAPDVAENLRKLSHGDFVTGNADLDFDKAEMNLESIDYVGIKRLLGTWYSPEGMFEVKTFDRLSFYPHSQLGFSKEKSYAAVSTPQEFHYSMSPTEGKEWVLFLSNNKSTTFATIQITRGKARLKMYDSETGVVTKTLRLIKWGSQ